MVNYKNWMKEIDDNTEVTKLSIPGTHNSAACHTALPSVQCQGKSVTEQLEHGVRFLDIRLAKLFLKENDEAKDLQVIHGQFPVKIPFPLKFTSVLKEIYEFLEDNKSETVIVSLKQEGQNTWDNDKNEFGDCIWDRYIKDDQDKWYLKNELPRIGDLRGKAVLFRRFGDNNNDRRDKFGFDASFWEYNCETDDRGKFCVQDFCEVQNEDDISKKVGYVKQLAEKAREYNSTNSDPKLFINFTSASNFFSHDCWPEQVAKQMKKSKIQDTFARGIGVVVLDYIDADDWKMSKELVDKNF